MMTPLERLAFIDAVDAHEFDGRESKLLRALVRWAVDVGRWPVLTRRELCHGAGIKGKDVHVVLEALQCKQCLVIEPSPQGECFRVVLAADRWRVATILTDGTRARLLSAVRQANGADQAPLPISSEEPSLDVLLTGISSQRSEVSSQNSPFAAVRAATGVHEERAPEDPVRHENPQLQTQRGPGHLAPPDPENRAGSHPHPKIGVMSHHGQSAPPPENRALMEPCENANEIGLLAPGGSPARKSGEAIMVHVHDHDHALIMDHDKKARGGSSARKSGGRSAPALEAQKRNARSLLVEHVFPRLTEQFRQSWSRRLDEDPELVEIAVEEALQPRLRNGAMRPANNVPAYANAFYLGKIRQRRAHRLHP